MKRIGTNMRINAFDDQVWRKLYFGKKLYADDPKFGEDYEIEVRPTPLLLFMLVLEYNYFTVWVD